MGGNLLLGHRFSASNDAVWGGYVAYDVRDTGNKVFNQIGLGIERLGKNWDIRANGYIPVGESKQVISESFRIITNSSGTGVLVQANNNANQTINITGQETRGTVKDTDGIGGQGIFIAANGNSQQNIKIENSTASDNAAQGIFVSANSGAKQTFSIDNSTATCNTG